jgi:hypothetical protein
MRRRLALPKHFVRNECEMCVTFAELSECDRILASVSPSFTPIMRMPIA